MSKGGATISVVTAVMALYAWCTALSYTIFTDHAQLASIQTSIESIKETSIRIENKIDNAKLIQSSSDSYFSNGRIGTTTEVIKPL